MCVSVFFFFFPPMLLAPQLAPTHVQVCVWYTCVSVRERGRVSEMERVMCCQKRRCFCLFVLSMPADTHGKSRDTVFPLVTHTLTRMGHMGTHTHVALRPSYSESDSDACPWCWKSLQHHGQQSDPKSTKVEVERVSDLYPSQPSVQLFLFSTSCRINFCR